MRVIVIGAGASGMAAALTAANKTENRVILLERQARVGKKLSATGNGRCNLSNAKAAPAYYHGADPGFVLPALSRHPVSETLDWFLSLGLYAVELENGKYYPFSEQASSVSDVLRFAIEASSVELKTGAEVRSLKKSGSVFSVRTDEESLEADAVIVACGGIAGSKLGGTLDGYKLLQGMGHSCTKLSPSLVQLCTDPGLVRSLKGIRSNCGVSVLKNGATIAHSLGEVQFTDYGLSGPAIFEISRAVSTDPKGCEIFLDLLPALRTDDAAYMLEQRISKFPDRSLDNLLTGLIQNRLGRTVLLAAGFSLETRCASLSFAQRAEIVALLKALPFRVEKTMGMEQAQVTAGGIRTSEFNSETLESRICPGLYACGEVLDVDGDCGGFNLQWAWSSGRLAGELSGYAK